MRHRPSAAAPLAVGLASAALVAAAALPASAATGTASLSVLHGVPDLTVDVWVDGTRTLDDFTPGSLAGPLDLPAGTHTVAITAADAADASSPAIGPVDLALDAGASYTAVAHLDAAGSPTATLFPNDTSAVPAGQGRLTVRHVAAAPAVDVLAAGSPVITNLANPDEQTLTVPAGTVPVAVAATGTTEPVLGPTDLDVAEGVSTIVYAWGSLEGGTLQLAVQTIDGMHSAPGGVPSGELGLVADGPSPAVLWLGGVALVAALGAVLPATRRPAEQRR
ncbi:DUF4397 domain-containing protein [Cellulomonas hominis]|uniref:DUF4397 domain-containing protein n=1 Tax=Cellulomonas hominis TaxID=156981 RepID=UPI001C1254C9|nr:DUF4397 domain-containing protein [Cellulomonas hominis]MBU5421094.1 DUF4397 domain-containing protein [Cellulomonas hominis]